MIQKILSTFLISIILFSTHTFAAYTDKDLILTRAELGQYSPYASQFDILIPRLSTERLEEIEGKLSASIGKIEGEKGALISYVGMLVENELETRGDESIEYLELSKAEKAQLEGEILSLQKDMHEQVMSLIHNIESNWDELVSYEEYGDLSMNFDLAIANFINANGSLDFRDYNAKNAFLDSSFSSQVTALFSSNSAFEMSESKIDLGANIDLIVKDGNTYVKISDIELETSEDMIFDISAYVDKLEALAKDNTYLSFGSSTDTQALSFMFDTFSAGNLKSSLEDIMLSPLMQVYGKTDEGMYLLEPTKHFCDSMKREMQVFDPFGGDTCSQRQYENMLEDFHSESISIGMNIGSETELIIMIDEEQAEGEIVFSWDKNGLQKIQGNISDPINSSNQFTLEYISKQKFNITFSSEEMIDIKIMNTLDKDNTISEGNYSLDIDSGVDTFAFSADYKNYQLSMSALGNMSGADISCNGKGLLKKTIGNMNLDCSLTSPDLAFMIPGVSKVDFGMMMDYDSRNAKNNLDFELYANAGEDNNFNLKISNIGKRIRLTNWEASVPESTKDFFELQAEIEEELYGDIYDDNFYYNFEDDSYSY